MIEIKHLCKSYGSRVALEDLQLKLANGAAYGILGAAGAGKTTLLELLAGVIAPSGGQVKINGYDTEAQSERARAQVGYLPASAALYEDMTPEELLTFLGEARGVFADRLRGQVRQALECVGLQDARHYSCEVLSEAERIRLGLAMLLPGEPEILLIDGLPTVKTVSREAAVVEDDEDLDDEDYDDEDYDEDEEDDYDQDDDDEEDDDNADRKASDDEKSGPVETVDVVSLVRQIAQDKTLFLAGRTLSELGGLCEQLLVLKEGQLIAFGSVEELQELLAEEGFVTSAAAPVEEPAVEQDNKEEADE